jgi:sec-independent protein translocase protein TatA
VGSVGPVEILVVLVVALLVLGPQKLPDAARSLGRAIGEVRRYTSGFQTEMRDAFAEPKPSTTPPPPATASETVPASETVSAGETTASTSGGPSTSGDMVDTPATSAHPDNGNALPS